uniref:Uncharacterized protein n=1 Tax=Onchocerca volvulus TaxID=6282 RepID=A0A8R1Y5P9_ONCVO
MLKQKKILNQVKAVKFGLAMIEIFDTCPTVLISEIDRTMRNAAHVKLIAN